MDWKERCKIECSCGNDIIAFICKETTCSNHNKQPLYCMQCMTNAAHWHQPLVFIRDEIEVYIQKWTSARQSLSTLLGEASKRYDELKPLIKYYEHEMLLVPVNGQPQSGRAIGQLSEKIAVLKNAGEEFKPIFADMEKLLAQTDLNQIKSNDSKLARILATIEQSSFLAELCETTLLDHYYPALSTTTSLHSSTSRRPTETPTCDSGSALKTDVKQCGAQERYQKFRALKN